MIDEEVGSFKQAGNAAAAAGDARLQLPQHLHARVLSPLVSATTRVCPFLAGAFEEAITNYTSALQHADPRDKACAALYSNRSAAYERLHRYSAALQDAQAASALRPDWDKARGI